MNPDESLKLKKLIGDFEGEYVDNTPEIRKLKHSELIRDDIRKLEVLKLNHPDTLKTAPLKFQEMAQNECFFLFSKYTDIFNKVLKNELDLDIMTQLLYVLKMIEEEKVDQHEGSVLVGKLLKELYIDSALKRGENLDKENETKQELNQGKEISWTNWKQKRKEIIDKLNSVK
jgi:hypothetical protein